MESLAGLLPYGGFHGHGGTPNSWMVFVRENPTKLDDDWGYPYDSGNHHMSFTLPGCV